MTDSQPNAAQVRLNALSEAARTITAELSLDRILKTLAQIAAKLVNARYAALGVPDGKGGLEQFHVYGMSEAEISQMDHLPLGKGLLGLLLTQPESIRLESIQDDPRSAGFCANHPYMKSFLGVPIMSRGKNLGNLYLTDRLDGQPFSEDDQRMVELLAAHAAVAIENAHLSEQLRKLAVIEERDRISMELHDGIIQAIYAIGIKLELTRLTLVQKPDVAAQIVSANEDLNRVIEDLRLYIQNLRASPERSQSMHEQLDEIVGGFRQVSTARLVMDIPQSVTLLDEAQIHALVQVTREALSNIVRHADATEVYIELRENPSHVTLSIADNGKGFDPDTVQGGSGLRNIQLRVQQLKGIVDISSQPGHGTTLDVDLPVLDGTL